eukprot:6200254-Pleurochrysis_carterae.AAC.2
MPGSLPPSPPGNDEDYRKPFCRAEKERWTVGRCQRLKLSATPDASSDHRSLQLWARPVGNRTLFGKSDQP